MWELTKAKLLTLEKNVLILVCVEVSVGVFSLSEVLAMCEGLNPCLCGS